MNQLEDCLRIALREVADEIPAGSVRPLRLPAGTARFNGGRHNGAGYDEPSQASFTGRRPRARRWLPPVAAAASLLAVAIGTAAIATQARHAPPRTRSAADKLPGNVPPYYVALHLVEGHLQDGPSYAAVTSTATGAVLATVRPPTPFLSFRTVSGAADDRTFVLTATTARPPRGGGGVLHLPATRLFRLTIDPTAPVRADRARLTPLPVPVQPPGTLVHAALSPDGTRLAVTSAVLVVGRVTRWHLHIYDLSTGTERRWLLPVGYALDRWLADNRTLSFTGTPHRAYLWTVQLLDTSAPGTGFAADARVVTRLSSSSALVWYDVTVTPDGRTLLVNRTTPGGRYPIFGVNRLQKYSVRTGRLTSLVDARTVGLGQTDQVEWSNLTGQVLITLIPQVPLATGPGIHTDLKAVIVVGTRRYDIPWGRTASTGAW